MATKVLQKQEQLDDHFDALHSKIFEKPKLFSTYFDAAWKL